LAVTSTARQADGTAVPGRQAISPEAPTTGQPLRRGGGNPISDIRLATGFDPFSPSGRIRSPWRQALTSTPSLSPDRSRVATSGPRGA